jgi:ZIP family zinc transporter
MPSPAEISAFGYTLFAGLATGVGSLIAILAKRKTSRFLSTALGFSAGVMIYVSLVELLNEARADLVAVLGPRPGAWCALAGFFGGIALIALIDKLVPPVVNPHESRAGEAAAYEAADAKACPAPEPSVGHHGRLLRTGLLTAFVVALHNFPEGVATFLSGMKDARVGVAVAVAIAIHNIPEGISISVPVYYATGSRRRAFWYSFASGLAEPAGAVIGYLFLRPFLGGPLFGLVIAAVAGIMVYISLDELLPAARELGEPHFAMGGLVAGMGVMAASLVLLA